MQLLKTCFLELRGKQGAVEGMTVTLRQLESLVRLSEARARMRLSETVSLVRSRECCQSVLAPRAAAVGRLLWDDAARACCMA